MKLEKSRLRGLLREMIDIYSPSGKEAEIVDFLGQYLNGEGLPVIRQGVDGIRENLLILPEGQEPQVVFVGHVDTAPAFDYDNYRCVEEDEIISGLGSADMKGGCAAIIEAFRVCWQNCKGEVPAALAMVVGEEETGDGTEAMLSEYHFPWAIVGEPTNLIPCLSHYGYIEIQLITYGRRVHASLADREFNAIRDMLQILLKLTSHFDSLRTEVVYNIRDVSSSEAGFAVPDRCEASVDLHLPPDAPLGEIVTELEELIGGLMPAHVRVDDVMTFSTIHAGYQLPDKGLVPDLLKSAYRSQKMDWKPGAFRSHSDANLLWGGGVRPVILGPGQLEKAHTADESINFAQVQTAAQIYLDTLCSLTS